MIGNTFNNIQEEIKQYLEHPPAVALPGGSWCFYCRQELCRWPDKHRNAQRLQLVIADLVRDLAEARKK